MSNDRDRNQQKLREMAQAVLNDEDIFEFESPDRGSPRRLSPLRGIDRFESPERNYVR